MNHANHIRHDDGWKGWLPPNLAKEQRSVNESVLRMGVLIASYLRALDGLKAVTVSTQ